jgi:hypothetical protein
MKFIYKKPTNLLLFFLFLGSLAVRSLVFYGYVQHQERYRQADSMDYHFCSFLLLHTKSMTRPDNQEPIFWRTPGYPFFLVLFYNWYGPQGITDFSSYEHAQKASLWVQILLTSCIPLILLALAWHLTCSWPLAWITALIAMLHLGFVLASTYLLTDALASIFFYLFLLFFYRLYYSFSLSAIKNSWVATAFLAALCLGIYTWLRPMGKFMGLAAALFLFVTNIKELKTAFKKALFFMSVFFLSLAPWYVRNYQLTGELFFCPMSGGILQAFCAPKILRRTHGLTLEQGLRALYSAIRMRTDARTKALQIQGSDKVVSLHLICQEVAWPIVAAHPWYTLYDWCAQVLKTMFDLYASQLVAFATNSHTYDPIEEFLIEKWALCLYQGNLPLVMRLIAWLETFFYLLLWVGIAGGLWLYLLKPFWAWFKNQQSLPDLAILWFKTILLIGVVVGMTGGFGYARLRLPVEPLIIILSLTFWLKSFLIENKFKKIIQ